MPTVQTSSCYRECLLSVVLEQELIFCIEKPLVKMSEHCWEERPATKTFQLFQQCFLIAELFDNTLLHYFSVPL